MAIARIDWFRAAACVAIAIGCVACHPRARACPSATCASTDPGRVGSNVLRRDYAGSDRCRPCHVGVYAAWSRSPMHRMTRRADLAGIRAPFDGASLHLGWSTATVRQVDDRRYLELAVEGRPTTLYRVTRVIGGRYREDFAGLPVDGTGPQAHTLGDPRAEMVLPLSYVYATRSWRYKGYSVMVPQRAGMSVGPEWRTTCIFCHNTVPYLATIYDQLLGQRAVHYQGVLHDTFLPPSRTWRFEVADADGLANALDEEIELLNGHRPAFDGADVPQLLARASRATWRRFDASHLVELGVGCEACHNGSAAHAADPRVSPTFDVRSPLVRVRPPGSAAPTEAASINRVCMRCHTVLFSHYPYTWEGGLRSDAAPGGSHINSGEARDFALGGCSGQMSCTSCHDPHGEDNPARLREIASPAGNAVCVTCHARYADAEALRAHSHHQPGGDGASCVACHMPRKNMGLNYALTRYHRIGSPTDPARVEHDRPLECALCHADRSVNSLVTTMEQWWGRTYDRNALRALYGRDLEVNVVAATLARGLPHEQAVAIGVLGEARDGATALARLVPQLNHGYPLVRFFAQHAIGRLVGELPPLEMHQDGAVLVEQASAWLRGRGVALPVLAPVRAAPSGPSAAPPPDPRARPPEALDVD